MLGQTLDSRRGFLSADVETREMRILLTGATGYIGGRLAPLLTALGHRVRCLTRDPKKLEGRFDGVDVVAGDALDATTIAPAMADVDAAFYLIHSMGSKAGVFARRDRGAARNFAVAARAAGVGRVLYLGGLGDSDSALSPHLRSRQEVGDILREFGPPVTEFRAAIIVGSGSASFEMIRYLTERLPVMIAPKWVMTRSQPIAVSDVLKYLTQALAMAQTAGKTYEIGGPDVLSYRELMLGYARARGLKRQMLIVPYFTPRLSSYWVHLVTPISAGIARPLIDGLHNEVIVHDDAARRDFSIDPIGYDLAVARALDRYRTDGPQTTWFDAVDARQTSEDFHGITQGMHIDRRTLKTTATQVELFDVIRRLGGARGWLFADWLWGIRGVLDRMVGGVGMRRGRRSPSQLRVGDAVDFWRVEAIEPPRLLRLRAEMKLPGNAWLEFIADRVDDSAVLRLTAFFEPRGLLGQAYWYAVMPLHNLVFGGLAAGIVAQAEQTKAVTALSSPFGA